MLKKCIGLANVREQLGQQHADIFAFKNVNVAGADARKLGHCHLALVGAALAEQHLPGLEQAGEGHAIGHIAPASNS